MRNKMTTEFNISSKLRLQDPASIVVNNIKITKQVTTWIKDSPLPLWEAVRAGLVWLDKGSHHKLKIAISVKHIDVYREHEKSKSRRGAMQRVKQKLVAERVSVVGKHSPKT